jgi:hypothetical protein
MKINISQLVRLDRINALFNADLSPAELTTLGNASVELGEGDPDDLIEQGLYMADIGEVVKSIVNNR